MSRHKLAIDIGGTFIDVVVVFDLDKRQLRAFKLPTTPHDPADGRGAAVGQLGFPPADIADFVHGTTLGLNAILGAQGRRGSASSPTKASANLRDRPRRRRLRRHVSLRLRSAATHRRASRHQGRCRPHGLRGQRSDALDERRWSPPPRRAGCGLHGAGRQFPAFYANTAHEREAVETHPRRLPGHRGLGRR